MSYGKSNPDELMVVWVSIMCYRGLRDNPLWIDANPG